MLKKPRINGRQRIGIVVSVLWMLGALIHNSNKPDWATALRQSCTTTALENPVPGGIEKCFAQWRADYPMASVTWRWNTAGDMLFPVLTGWILAAIILGTYRWVRVGFLGAQP